MTSRVRAALPSIDERMLIGSNSPYAALLSLPLAVSAGAGIGLVVLAFTMLAWLQDLHRPRADGAPPRRPWNRYLWAQRSLLATLGLSGWGPLAGFLGARAGLAVAVYLTLNSRFELAPPLAAFGAVLGYWLPGGMLEARSGHQRRRRAALSLAQAKCWAVLLASGEAETPALTQAAALVGDPARLRLTSSLAGLAAGGGLAAALTQFAPAFDDPVFDALCDLVLRAHLAGSNLAHELELSLPGLGRRLHGLRLVGQAQRRVRAIVVAGPLLYLAPILLGRINPTGLSGYGFDYLRPEGLVFEVLISVVFALGYRALAGVMQDFGRSEIQAALG